MVSQDVYVLEGQRVRRSVIQESRIEHRLTRRHILSVDKDETKVKEENGEEGRSPRLAVGLTVALSMMVVLAALSVAVLAKLYKKY